MSDESTAPAAEAEATTEATETSMAPAPEPTKVEDFPQAAQRLIRELREEAADKRQKAKSAAQEAKTTAQAENDETVSKLNQEKADVEAQRDDALRVVSRMRAAVQVGIPAESMDDFVSRLRGETDEEIQADAESLAELFSGTKKPDRKSDPSQGASGSLNDVAPGMARLRHAYTSA